MKYFRQQNWFRTIEHVATVIFTTTLNESQKTTAGSCRIFSNDSRSNAIRCATVPRQIPLENIQTAFPFEL